MQFFLKNAHWTEEKPDQHLITETVANLNLQAAWPLEGRNSQEQDVVFTILELGCGLVLTIYC